MPLLSAIGAGWSAILAVVATWGALRARAAAADGRAPPGPPATPALLLRPCAGDEPSLAQALASSKRADAGTRVLFLVARASDPAVPAAILASAELQRVGRRARVLVTGAGAPNMKAAQLARALETEPAEPGQIVVVADSDVSLSNGAWRAVVDALRRDEADAAWAPPIEPWPQTLADRASSAVLAGSMHAFPLLAGLDREGMVGKLFAVRRDALDAIGGFGGLVQHLGEDVELARRLRARGYRVKACAAVAVALASGRTWHEVLDRYTRWIAVVRAQRPSLLPSYPLLLAATPLALLLEGGASALEGLAAARAAVVTLALRWWIGALARHSAGLPPKVFGIIAAGLAADVLLLCAFVRAVTRRDVVWRGRRLVLAPHGTVEREP